MFMSVRQPYSRMTARISSSRSVEVKYVTGSVPADANCFAKNSVPGAGAAHDKDRRPLLEGRPLCARRVWVCLSW